MLIEEGVLGRGGRITTSEICTILLIIHKLNSIIVLHYDFLVSLLILVITDLNDRFPYLQRYIFCRKLNTERRMTLSLVISVRKLIESGSI